MISSVTEFIANTTKNKPLPWLILGKGPTANRLPLVLGFSRYHVFTLNHACKICAATVAHFIDLDAYMDCRYDLTISQTPAVALPWHPHILHKPGKETLVDHCRAEASLQTFNRNNMLVSYNSTTAGRLPANPKLPRVVVRLFSAVAAFNILGLAGVKEVRTLGIDDGDGYARSFDPKTLLANGQKSFDVQVPEIRKAMTKYGMTWTKL